MQCFVYRSSKIDGLYVYMTEENCLDQLPSPLIKQLGNAELALSFELLPDRPLTSEDPAEVISNLESVGFHVQMPPKVESLLTI